MSKKSCPFSYNDNNNMNMDFFGMQVYLELESVLLTYYGRTDTVVHRNSLHKKILEMKYKPASQNKGDYINYLY